MTAVTIRRADGYDEISQHPLDRLCRLREDVELRRNTFEGWPAHKRELAIELCENGFYYFGISDKVQCVYCGGVLSNWTSKDEVCTQHARHFRSCEFARNKAVNTLTITTAHVEQKKLQPKYKEFVDFNARLASFTLWPNTMKQRPKELAEAGLFYTGQNDQCKCYSCGLALSEWEEGDVPQTEHNRWNPKCPLSR